MSGIEGIDEFDDFADTMSDISNQQSGIGKAKRDALRDTADDFLDYVTDFIKQKNTNPDEGPPGTLYSETSPYKPGGENESTGSTKHIQHKSSWGSMVVGNDFAAIFPKPEIFKRASWLEYGTDDHGPTGDEPMLFYVNGTTIVVTEGQDDESGKYTDNIPFSGRDAVSVAAGSAVGEGRDVSNTMSPPTAEVSGVEPQRFFRDAEDKLEKQRVFEENMAGRLNEAFQEERVPLEGDWYNGSE